MDAINSIGIIIPAFDPTSLMVGVVQGLVDAGFKHVIVVDDGSGASSTPFFYQIKSLPAVVLLKHDSNQGKGAALKTGLRYIQAHLASDVIGAVTLDADAQHLLKDILAVANRLVESPHDLILGEREFGQNVPWRSKFGNSLTRTLFGWMYKQNLKDTQTGLRGIPFELIPDLLAIPYNGYEYELDCLKVIINKDVKIRSVDIDTVYINDNESSHFNPLVDSIKIYYVFFRYLIVAVLSFVVDLAVFVSVHAMTDNIILSLLAARIVSGTFNFYQNKFNVYRANDKAKIRREVINYLCLAVLIFFGSYAFIYTFHQLLGVGVITSKVIGDIILFTISFIVQKLWIFKSRIAL